MTTPKNDHLCKHVLTISYVCMTATCASMLSPRIKPRYRRLESIVSTDWARPAENPSGTIFDQSLFHVFECKAQPNLSIICESPRQIDLSFFVPRNILFWRTFPSMKKYLFFLWQVLPTKLLKKIFLMGLFAWPFEICKLKGQVLLFSVLFRSLPWAFRMLKFMSFAVFPDRILDLGTFGSGFKLQSLKIAFSCLV